MKNTLLTLIAFLSLSISASAQNCQLSDISNSAGQALGQSLAIECQTIGLDQEVAKVKCANKKTYLISLSEKDAFTVIYSKVQGLLLNQCYLQGSVNNQCQVQFQPMVCESIDLN